MAFDITTFNDGVSYLSSDGNGKYGHLDAADVISETFSEFKTGPHVGKMFQGQTVIILNGNNPVELIKGSTGATTFSDFVIRRFPIFDSKESFSATTRDIITYLCESSGRNKKHTNAFNIGMTATVIDGASYKTYVITKVEKETGTTNVNITWDEQKTAGVSSKTTAELVEGLNRGESYGVVSFAGEIYSYVDDGRIVYTDNKEIAATHGNYETYPGGVYASTVNQSGDVMITVLSNDIIDCGSWED